MRPAFVLLWAPLMAALFIIKNPPVPFALWQPLRDPATWRELLGVWGTHFLAASALLVWLLFLAAWGRPVMLLVRSGRLGPGQSKAAAMGAGFGLLGLAVLGLGLTGLLFPAAILAAAVSPVPFLLRSGIGSLPSSFRPRSFWPFLAALPALVALPAMLAPETSWDAVVYHLRDPQFYLYEHKHFLLPDSPFAGYPCLTEMHYLTGISLTGLSRLAKLQHAACWLMTARLLFLAARPISPLAGHCSSLLWLALPLGMHLAGMAYVDLSCAWMAALCAFMLLRVGRAGTGSAVLAGLFAGFAFFTKYTGGFAIAGMLGFLAARFSGAAGLAALAGAATPVILWSGRNWLLAGNPVYPFFPGILGGLESVSAAHWAAAPPALLAEPLLRFWRAVTSDGGGVDVVTGPLWAAAAIPAFAFGKVNRLIIFAAAGFACWLALPLNCRFLMPLLPALYLALLPAWRDRLLRSSLVAALILLAPLGIWHGAHGSFSQYDPILPALGLRSHEGYMRTGMLPQPEYWLGSREANRRLPRKARLLFLGGIKSYGFERRGKVAHGEQDPVPLKRLIRGAGSPRRLSVVLRQRGFTHLAYLPRPLLAMDLGELELSDPEAEILVRWLESGTRFSFRAGEFLLYEIHPPSAPRELGRVPLLEDAALNAATGPDGPGVPRPFRQLARLAPRSSSAALLEGFRVLRRTPEDAGGAVLPLERAIRAPDASALAWRGYGFALWRRGELARALIGLEKAVSLSPGDPDIRLDLGNVLRDAGRPDLAAAHLKVAARLAPGREDILRALEAVSVRGLVK